MVVRHHVDSHVRDGYQVTDYMRGKGRRVVPFGGEYQGPSLQDVLQKRTGINAVERAEEDVRERGAPDWWPRFIAAQQIRAERGPESQHRILHPSYQDLDKSEADTLRLLEEKYDSSMNVRQTDPEIDMEAVKSLRGAGFVRVINGRIIPNWVFTENDAKDLGRFQTQ